MHANITYDATSDIEQLVGTVTDLQRQHAELEIILTRINREIEHRSRDITNMTEKYESMKQEYSNICHETDCIRASAETSKAEFQSAEIGCSQLAQSIQSMKEKLQGLQAKQEIERQKFLKTIAITKETYSKRNHSTKPVKVTVDQCAGNNVPMDVVDTP